MFCKSVFNESCSNHEIYRHHTLVGKPQQNGIAGRMNMTLLERARCMLSNPRLGREFLVEVASLACYLVNHSQYFSLDFKILEEEWPTNPIDYYNLRVMSCLCTC